MATDRTDEPSALTDAQYAACVALLDLLCDTALDTESACDRCDYCNCPLVRVTFTTPTRITTHSHCLNCGGYRVGEQVTQVTVEVATGE